MAERTSAVRSEQPGMSRVQLAELLSEEMAREHQVAEHIREMLFSEQDQSIELAAVPVEDVLDVSPMKA